MVLARKEMLSTGEVAKALGVTINTVKNWVGAGKVEAVRLPSGHYRIPRSELESLLKGESAQHELRRQFALRAEAWKQYESWRRAQPVDERPIDEAIAWAGAMLNIARAQGPVPEPSLEETANRVRRMHKALAHVRR